MVTIEDTFELKGAVLVGTHAAVANVFIDYLSGFWPQAKGPGMRCAILTLLIGGLAAANIRGARTGTWLSNFFTVSKLLPLVLLVVGGLLFLYLHGSPVLLGAESHPAGAWMNAVLLLVFAYSGFDSAAIEVTIDSAPGRSLSSPTACPQTTATISKSFFYARLGVFRGERIEAAECLGVCPFITFDAPGAGTGAGQGTSAFLDRVVTRTGDQTEN